MQPGEARVLVEALLLVLDVVRQPPVALCLRINQPLGGEPEANSEQRGGGDRGEYRSAGRDEVTLVRGIREADQACRKCHHGDDKEDEGSAGEPDDDPPRDGTARRAIHGSTPVVGQLGVDGGRYAEHERRDP